MPTFYCLRLYRSWLVEEVWAMLALVDSVLIGQRFWWAKPLNQAPNLSLEPLERPISFVANAPQIFPRNNDATKICYKVCKRL